MEDIKSDIYKIDLGEFKDLGYTNYCPIYNQEGIVNIDIYDDDNNRRITIDKIGATKEVRDEDEDRGYYSCSSLTYDEMRAACSFIEKHKIA